MFKLTSAAAKQIQQAANSTGAQQLALRVAARMESDGSVQYGMGFDDPKDEDMKLDLEGVAVVIADDSQELLDETVLDFVELTPGQFNFIFIDGKTFPLQDDAGTSGGCGNGSCTSGGCGAKGRTH